MATGGADPFLQAEEEANRLLDELAQLKQEAESYKTARETFDRAAEGVGALAARAGELAVQLGAVVAALRSIGTPELLRAQEAVAGDVAALREELTSMQRLVIDAHRRDIGAVVRSMRLLSFGGGALLVVMLALLGWIIASPR